MKLKFEDYERMVESVRKLTDFKPLVGIVLGTGLGNFIDNVDVKATIKYSEIPNLPKGTNLAHKGQFVFGYFNDIPCVFMQGRLHYYEGYTTEEVTRPIRLMGFLGIKHLILTNACGGINFNFHVGDFMLLEDHIDCFIPSPLRGENDDRLGPRFLDVTEPYDLKLVNEIYSKAKELNLPIQKGVYLQYPGPQFETRTLIKAFRTLGADTVGMSTVVEAIAAHHQNLKTIGISFISNLACGMSKEKISDEEVQVEAKKGEKNFTTLLGEAIKIVANDK